MLAAYQKYPRIEKAMKRHEYFTSLQLLSRR